MARNEAISTLANQICKILLLNDIIKISYIKIVIRNDTGPLTGIVQRWLRSSL